MKVRKRMVVRLYAEIWADKKARLMKTFENAKSVSIMLGTRVSDVAFTAEVRFYEREDA